MYVMYKISAMPWYVDHNYYVVNDKIIVTLQVRIPSGDTTYWCKTQRLPQEVIDQTHYITSVSEIQTECITCVCVCVCVERESE